VYAFPENDVFARPFYQKKVPKIENRYEYMTTILLFRERQTFYDGIIIEN
jgi:hypothetical protein